jgi:hypothetical protein
LSLPVPGWVSTVQALYAWSEPLCLRALGFIHSMLKAIGRGECFVFSLKIVVNKLGLNRSSVLT